MTRIPPAITRQDLEDDVLFGSGDGLYIVMRKVDGAALKTGLTRRQAVDYAWLFDGRDYEVKPRDASLQYANARSSSLPGQQEDRFGLEWDVLLKDGADEPWRSSGITAYGPTHRTALLHLLDQAYDRQAWSQELDIIPARSWENKKVIEAQLAKTKMQSIPSA